MHFPLKSPVCSESSLNAQLHSFTVMPAFVSVGFGSQSAIEANNLLQVVTFALSASATELAHVK